VNCLQGHKSWSQAGGALFLKTQLQDLADDVLDGSINRADGATVSQILNVLLRAITTELQVKEQMELIERLEALEQGLEAQKRPYGA